jgi:hypothetical protein
MKRTAPAQLFALIMLFAISTCASNAFDLNLGRFGHGRQQAVSPAELREYEALSVPRARGMAGSDSGDYMPDVTGQGTYTWQADKMPIKVFVSDGKGVPGYRPEMGRYIRTSFDWWSQASGNKITWVEVTDAAKADITVYWTDKVFERPEGTEAGKTACLTRLNTVTGKGIIYGARMQMLTRLPGRDFGDAEVSKTCLHEAGHAFGLQGHSHNRDDIMYYAVNPGQEFELSTRDKATMAHLYATYPVSDGLAVGPKPAPAIGTP